MEKQVYKRNERVRQWAPRLWEYLEGLIRKHVELGNLKVDASNQ